MAQKSLFHLNIIARLSLGLVAMIVSLFLTLDIIFKILPNEDNINQENRKHIAEGLAIQLVGLLDPSNDPTMVLNNTIQQIVIRDPEITSIGIRKPDGWLQYKTDSHRQYWYLKQNDLSTQTNIRVPIYSKQTAWGNVEISFKSHQPVTLLDWLIKTKALWLTGIALLSAGLIYIYLGRVLRSLDPSKAIPTRVNDAFDIIDDGILVLDRKGHIVLANDAFTTITGSNQEELYGRHISETSINNAMLKIIAKEAMPWNSAASERTMMSDIHIDAVDQNNNPTSLLVSCAPISDDNETARGFIVTFKNITELHKTNQKLNNALDELEHSRHELEKNNQQLLEMAYRDSLTGCLNRRAFFQQAEDLYLNALQGNRELFCIMADIDFFKSFNDIYGHYIGDQVIQIVAKIFQSSLRPSDLICRYGGEEFCIFLTDLKTEEVSEVCERIRKTIEETGSQSIRTVKVKPITISFGIASINSGANSVENLIDYADSALYISKESGRNQITHWTSSLNS